MTEEEIEQGIKDLLADVMRVDPQEITMETNFVEDLKADSMDQFFLIDGIQEKFGVNVADEDARQIQTMADAVEFVKGHLPEGK
jgi:acyl carrier protein